MERPGAEAVLRRAIKHVIPDAERVLFDRDGEHAYIALAGGKAIRYQLGTDAQRFLNGELSVAELSADAVILRRRVTKTS